MTNQILGLVLPNFRTSTQNLALLGQEEKGLIFPRQTISNLSSTKVFVNIKNPYTNTESSTSVSEFLLLKALLLSVDSRGTSKQTDSFVSLCTSDMSIIISQDVS